MSHSEPSRAGPGHPPEPPDPPERPAARAGMVLLHGRHMKATVLEPFVHALSLPVRCLAPAGPLQHEDGSRSWWAVDIRQREAEIERGPIDLATRYPAGRAAARELLARSVDALHAAQPAGEPLLLAGFSQGGMLALDYLLHSGDARIRGLALLSSSRIAIDEWRPRLARVAGLPVLVAHGRRDAHLSFEAGRALHDMLAEAGARVQWLPFDGGHELPLVVWRGLRRFVQSFVDDASSVG